MALGVNVTNPVVVFTETDPLVDGVNPETVNVALFNGPPFTLHLAQTEIGVLIPVDVNIGLATGGVPVTLTVINALVQETGNRLQIL